MPDRPLIILPAPAVAQRSRLPGGAKTPHLPGSGRQGERLGPKFDVLRAYFEQRRVQLLASAAGQMGGEVMVFVTVGSIANFLAAPKGGPWVGVFGGLGVY